MAVFDGFGMMESVEDVFPSEETPLEETPLEETPLEEAPLEETPLEGTPLEEAPLEEAPLEETPLEEPPLEETPLEEAPLEDSGLGGILDEDDMGSDLSDASLYDRLLNVFDAFADDLSEDVSVSGEEDALSESDVSDVSEGQEDAPCVFTFGDSQYLLTIDGESFPFAITALSDLDTLPYAMTGSGAAYTPQIWQVNLAENRSFGEHYVMWAERVYSGSSYHWRYYLALGRQISYASDLYVYTDAEVYTYYSYNGSVTYDVSVSSGSVSGSSYLVYSDLFFVSVK